jgi:hypothetical protein
MFLKKAIGVGKGKNVSGTYINDGGYVLVYSFFNNCITERKYVLGTSAPENFTGQVVSMGEMLAKNSAFSIESIKGRLRQIV